MNVAAELLGLSRCGHAIGAQWAGRAAACTYTYVYLRFLVEVLFAGSCFMVHACSILFDLFNSFHDFEQDREEFIT